MSISKSYCSSKYLKLNSEKKSDKHNTCLQLDQQRQRFTLFHRKHDFMYSSKFKRMIITDYRTSIFLRRSSEGNIDSYEYTDLEISRQLENICFVAQLDLHFVMKLPR